MTANDIVEKIKRILDSPPITDEPQVVYILVEIRKLFERDEGLRQTFSTLHFYCNWALHTTLDRKDARFFLNAVEPILTLQGNHTRAQQEEFDHLLTLGSFREDLTSFLAHKGLATSICEDPGHWNTFLESYACVVGNCELVLKGGGEPSGPLSLTVDSVSIRSVAGDLSGDRPYPMEWIISYTDGRQGRLSLSNQGLLGAVVEIL